MPCRAVQCARSRADLTRDVLHCSTAALPTPALPVIAKGAEGFERETCLLAGLILAIVVKVGRSCVVQADPSQSSRRQAYIDGIQTLETWVQREIMWSIEQVRFARRRIQLMRPGHVQAAAAHGQARRRRHRVRRACLARETDSSAPTPSSTRRSTSARGS